MRSDQPARLLAQAALVCSLLAGGPTPARAELALKGIQVTYHGGALLQHVQVVPLLYGASWQGSAATGYLQGFLQTLFADGRYLANLAQYSAGGLQISNGTALDPVVDAAVLPKVRASQAAAGVRYEVTGMQVLAEIKAQVTAHQLPSPAADTLYLVCVPADVVVIDGNEDSENDFAAYHDYDTEIGAAYAVITGTGDRPATFNRDLTIAVSHELAEAVTDPHDGGWFDENKPDGGEIADIPDTLNYYGFITDDQLYDVLTGTDGSSYVVQKVWSNQAEAPVAFVPIP